MPRAVADACSENVAIENLTQSFVRLHLHEVRLFADGEEVSSGRGEIALGNPLNALAWIANTLPAYGRHLKVGEIVTTGVCMPVYPAQAGQHIRADFGSLGAVEIQF